MKLVKYLTIMFCVLSFNSYGQTKKVESIYVNLQGKGGMDFMNPLQLGLALASKKPSKSFKFGISGYYPNNSSLYPYSNYNYNYYNSYNTNGDTTNFVSRNLSNGGIGLSIGINQDFKLFKKLNLNSGLTLNNMINISKSSILYGKAVRMPNGVPFYTEITSQSSSTKVSYIPVLETYFGARFTMGKHLLLNPRLNTNIAMHKDDALFRSQFSGQMLRLTMRPSIALGYKF